MAKWYGKIGYAMLKETNPGVWEEGFVERNYYGDIERNTRRLESSGNVNDNINISNLFSIVADQFACDNFHDMRYLEFMGAKWKIKSVEVKRPRLVLTVGGVFNDGE